MPKIPQVTIERMMYIAQDKLNKISDYDSFNGNGYNGFNGGYSNKVVNYSQSQKL